MAAGRIYIMANACMPNLVKIGKTAGSPAARANQLWSSGVPVPFRVIYSQRMQDIHSTEARIFRALRQYRWHNKREFFHLHPDEAVRIVKTLLIEATLNKPEYVMAKTPLSRTFVARRHPRLLRELVQSVLHKEV